MQSQSSHSSDGDFEVSFGLQCSGSSDYAWAVPSGKKSKPVIPKNRSFSCLSGAALSANATLANTNLCNGLIGEEILPNIDSPTSFRRVPSSPNFSKFEFLSSSLPSSSYLSCSPSSPEDDSSYFLSPTSYPSKPDSFLNSMELQVAGGAAGEDRVQAVCSEENGWLFCGVYDGFNGRDAADFLAGTFYETILSHTRSLDWESQSENNVVSDSPSSFQHQVLGSLMRALSQAENDYLHMVEQEMVDRPDLVSVGSCVLTGLIHGSDLYILNLGDSRAVLATYNNNKLTAVQLTETHTVDNKAERIRLQAAHPNDRSLIVGGKVKGKLKVTRAFGVGYLKKAKLNEALMGILRVRNLTNPPYISTEPLGLIHRITKWDDFIIFASDGLFDFLTNDEAVNLVHKYVQSHPHGDPAKFLLEQLICKAANSAGFSLEELMSVPAGRRRKYHDDVTVVVIILGPRQRTSTASTKF